MENDFFKASNDTYVFKNNSEFSQNIHSTPGRAAQGGMGAFRAICRIHIEIFFWFEYFEKKN